jgi:sigma-B regulation protein RsbU (phosphoserine phosphatase)
VVDLPTGGIPLGIEETAILSEVHVELSPGDVLLLYTDGLVDAESEPGEFYGSQRLTEALKKNGQRSAAQIVEAIGSSVEEFAAGKVPFDDLTMVAVKYTG